MFNLSARISLPASPRNSTLQAESDEIVRQSKDGTRVAAAHAPAWRADGDDF
jgi:hypothetical protein